jgi:hypothetical protein
MTTPQTPQLPPLPEPDAVFYCSEDTGYLTQYRRPPANLTEGDMAMYDAETVRAYARAALEAQKAAVPELTAPQESAMRAAMLAEAGAAPELVGLTDDQCDLAIGLLDEIAREYDHYEYGLPEFFLHGVDSESDEQHKSMASRMRNAVRSGINNLPTGTASDGGEG